MEKDMNEKKECTSESPEYMVMTLTYENYKMEKKKYKSTHKGKPIPRNHLIVG